MGNAVARLGGGESPISIVLDYRSTSRDPGTQNYNVRRPGDLIRTYKVPLRIVTNIKDKFDPDNYTAPQIQVSTSSGHNIHAKNLCCICECGADFIVAKPAVVTELKHLACGGIHCDHPECRHFAAKKANKKIVCAPLWYPPPPSKTKDPEWVTQNEEQHLDSLESQIKRRKTFTKT